MKITVGIATNNRPDYLDKCLFSIKSNTYLPDEVIIADNSLGRESCVTVNKYKNILPIKHIFETKSGTSHVRNAIIKAAKNDILVFIDDDTRLSKDYFKHVLLAHEKYSKVIAIQGKSISLPKNHLIVDMLYVEYQHWIYKHNTNNYLDILDTKNASLKLKKLKKLIFKFDPIFAQFNKGEDFDLALFLVNKKEKILYYPKILNYHYENTNLFNVIKRRIDAGKAKWHIDSKWGEKKIVFNKKKLSLRNKLITIFLLKIPYSIGYFLESINERVRFFNDKE